MENYYYYYYYYYCGSTAFHWALAAISVSWSYTQSIGLLGRGSARRKASTYTQNNTNREWTHTDIHAFSGIRTQDHSVRAGEDGSCLRPRGHCDRLLWKIIRPNYNLCWEGVVITDQTIMIILIYKQVYIFSWGGVRLSQFFTSATTWPIVPAPSDRWWW
jgi:hypothetical protein